MLSTPCCLQRAPLGNALYLRNTIERLKCATLYPNIWFALLRQGLVDSLVAEKTARGEFVPHPDLPDRVDARMYPVFNTTEWGSGSSKESARELRGVVNDLTAKQGHSLSVEFMQAKLSGPTAFMTAPKLQFAFEGVPSKVASGVTGAGKAAGKAAKGKNSKAKPPALHSEDPPAAPPKQAAKPKADTTMLTSFKVLNKVLTELTGVQKMDQRISLLQGGTPFANMLGEHAVSLGVAYEKLRVALAITPPNMDPWHCDREITRARIEWRPPTTNRF